jgi:Uncharacterized protein conserved in bacteria (DUF2252)
VRAVQTLPTHATLRSGESAERGREARRATPRSAHGQWAPDDPRHPDVRQLWDRKASAGLATLSEPGLRAHTRACGWSLARAHARSGDRLAIAAHLGAGAVFDEAIARFAVAYADQNELDHRRLAEALAAGEIRAQHGV